MDKCRYDPILYHYDEKYFEYIMMHLCSPGSLYNLLDQMILYSTIRKYSGANPVYIKYLIEKSELECIKLNYPEYIDDKSLPYTDFK